MTNLRKLLIEGGVRNLRDYGYPSVTADNIITDQIYRQFFDEMLKSNLGAAAEIDAAIKGLRNEIAEQSR